VSAIIVFSPWGEKYNQDMNGFVFSIAPFKVHVLLRYKTHQWRRERIEWTGAEDAVKLDEMYLT